MNDFYQAFEFYQYVRQFYGKGEIYDLGVADKDIAFMVGEFLLPENAAYHYGMEFCGDSADREHFRDFMIEKMALEV